MWTISVTERVSPHSHCKTLAFDREMATLVALSLYYGTACSPSNKKSYKTAIEIASWQMGVLVKTVREQWKVSGVNSINLRQNVTIKMLK